MDYIVYADLLNGRNEVAFGERYSKAVENLFNLLNCKAFSD